MVALAYELTAPIFRVSGNQSAVATVGLAGRRAGLSGYFSGAFAATAVAVCAGGVISSAQIAAGRMYIDAR